MMNKGFGLSAYMALALLGAIGHVKPTPDGRRLMSKRRRPRNQSADDARAQMERAQAKRDRKALDLWIAVAAGGIQRYERPA